VIPHDNAGLVLYDEAAGDLVVQFLGGPGSEVFPGELRVPIDGSLSGIAFRTREPVLLESIARAPYAPETLAYLKRMGMQSGCWVPLVHQGKSLGALSVVSRQEGSFGQRELEMLVQIAGQVAMAVDNAMAFRRIAELRDRLDQEKQYLEEEINSSTASTTSWAKAPACAACCGRLRPSRPPTPQS
jgi:formate hydrogenlyase transcriptional activator